MTPDILPDPRVIGIAILGEKKNEIIPPNSPLKDALPDFFCMKYNKEKEPVNKKYDSSLAYGLHCKIFNPGYPFIYLSAAMFVGDKIELDTRLSSVEDLRKSLIYPEICKEEEQDKFHRNNFQLVKDEFPDQKTTKYFFYKKFLFDYRYPKFYDNDGPLTLILRVGTSHMIPHIDWVFAEQEFRWEIK